MGLFELIQNSSFLVVAFYLLAFIIAMFVIVFIHEYGHFIVGRLCGVKIETFSVGFGKELFGFNDKYGTRWKLAAIPLGGFVKFEGDANAASMPNFDAKAAPSPTSLMAQPVHERMAIVAAGPIANFILAIVIFTAGFMAIGVPYMRPIVDGFTEESLAEKSGMKIGDEVISVDGKKIATFSAIAEAVFLRADEIANVTVKRNGAPVELQIKINGVDVADGYGGKNKVGRLGLSHKPRSDEPLYERFAPHEAFGRAVERTWFVVSTTGHFIKKLFTGQQSIKQVGGVGSIAKTAGDAATGGWMNFVYFIGFLSISVGIINLFPIPMLDGGHLVFYAIEALRGKPLSPTAQEWGYRIGFTCVIMLMLLGVVNDVGRGLNWAYGG
jgi:regulator of sigma E protease